MIAEHDIDSSFKELMEEVSHSLIELDNEGEAVIPALEEGCSHESPRARAFAGWMIIGLAKQNVGLIEDAVMRRASDAIVHGLKSKSSLDRMLTLLLLTIGNVPHGIEPVLIILLESKNAFLRTAAASALSTIDPGECEDDPYSPPGHGRGRSKMMAILRGALEDPDPDCVTLAVGALARLSIRVPEAAAKLVEAIRIADHETIGLLFEGMKALDESIDLEVKHALIDAVVALDAYPFLMGLGMVVLGSVCGTESACFSVIAAGLDSEDTFVVQRAIEGLEHARQFRGVALQAIREKLEATNGLALSAILDGLRAAPGLARDCLQDLLGMMEREVDPINARTLAGAIAAAGSAAVPELIGLIKEGDITKQPTITMALWGLGGEAAVAIAKELARTPDPYLFSVLLDVIRVMRRSAADAAPQLAVMLTETEDEEVASFLISALDATESSEASVVRALVETVVNRSEALAFCALRALRAIGPEALPIIRIAYEQSSEEARGRLADLLQSVDSGSDRFAAFRRLGNDSVVHTLVHVGKVLQECGPMSFRDVELELERRKKLGDVPASLRISNETISLHFKKLRKVFGFAMSTHAPRRRKGEMSEQGLRVLKEGIEYLASRM